MAIPHSETYGKQASPPKTTSSIKLEITRVTPLWPRKAYIQWHVRNAQASTGFTFNVYRSSSPDGPWSKLTDDLVDTYWYSDDDFSAPQDRTSAGLVQMRMAFYYRVTARYADEPEVEALKAMEAGLDHRRVGIVRKLTRDAYISLRKGNGTEVAVLKRMWYGDTCPVCRASVGQVTRAHCSTCNGTGIVKGYWNPVYTYARRLVSPFNTHDASQGIVDSNRMQAILPGFPEVAAEDVLVFLRDARRFMVEQVNTTEIHTVTVHQECTISEIARTSREYAIKVDPWRDPQWF